MNWRQALEQVRGTTAWRLRKLTQRVNRHDHQLRQLTDRIDKIENTTDYWGD